MGENVRFGRSFPPARLRGGMKGDCRRTAPDIVPVSSGNGIPTIINRPYLMEYSCLKTLASKHKTSLSKIIDKFNDGTGKWGIPYETKLGSKRRYFANYADCKGKAIATDYISNAAVVYGYAVNTLENRLKAKVCELCGTTESDHYEVHHINKLKNLKGKERWEIAMIAKHRKTLVVCRDCHRSIIHKK